MSVVKSVNVAVDDFQTVPILSKLPSKTADLSNAVPLTKSLTRIRFICNKTTG